MQQTLAQKLGLLATLLASCLFALVVARGWVMHALPNSGNVFYIAVGGMLAVGGVASFVVCALTNLMARVGPKGLRLPLSAAAWLGVCAIAYLVVRNMGGDHDRQLMLVAVGTVSGLLFGPVMAEMIVGTYFVRKILSNAKAACVALEAEAERAAELREQAAAKRSHAVRVPALDELDRQQAIRNYFRS